MRYSRASKVHAVFLLNCGRIFSLVLSFFIYSSLNAKLRDKNQTKMQNFEIRVRENSCSPSGGGVGLSINVLLVHDTTAK